MTFTTQNSDTTTIENEIATFLRQIGDELNTAYSLESDNIVVEHPENSSFLHSDQEGTNVDLESINVEAEDQKVSTDEDTTADNDVEFLLSDDAQQSPISANDVEDLYQETHTCLECALPSTDLMQSVEPMPTTIPDFIG